MDDRSTLPTLDKSDHRNIIYYLRAWGQGERGGETERERDRESVREGGRERESGGCEVPEH